MGGIRSTITKDKLITIINELKKNKQYTNRSQLCKDIELHPLAIDHHLSYATAQNRIIEWSIDIGIKNSKKGRNKLIIKKQDLIKKINELESKQKYTTRTNLFNDVGKFFNTTGAVIYLRVKEFNIEPKTPKGKRGQGLTELRKRGINPNATRSSRANKIKKCNINALYKTVPQQYHSVIKQVEKGSLKGILKAKCLDCCNYDKNEIKNCEIIECALWSIRPYQIQTIN